VTCPEVRLGQLMFRCHYKQPSLPPSVLVLMKLFFDFKLLRLVRFHESAAAAAILSAERSGGIGSGPMSTRCNDGTDGCYHGQQQRSQLSTNVPAT
jgi:hypothetical protein